MLSTKKYAWSRKYLEQKNLVIFELKVWVRLLGKSGQKTLKVDIHSFPA